VNFRALGRERKSLGSKAPGGSSEEGIQMSFIIGGPLQCANPLWGRGELNRQGHTGWLDSGAEIALPVCKSEKSTIQYREKKKNRETRAKRRAGLAPGDRRKRQKENSGGGPKERKSSSPQPIPRTPHSKHQGHLPGNSGLLTAEKGRGKKTSKMNQRGEGKPHGGWSTEIPSTEVVPRL